MAEEIIMGKVGAELTVRSKLQCSDRSVSLNYANSKMFSYFMEYLTNFHTATIKYKFGPKRFTTFLDFVALLKF